MKNLKLYTVGYEGQDIDHFVEGLKKKRVKTVADLRKNPLPIYIIPVSESHRSGADRPARER